MKLRTEADIFPHWYSDRPDEEVLRRRCCDLIDHQLPPEQISRQIDKEECPYTREWLVTLFFEELYAKAEDEGWCVNTYLQEVLEQHLRPIVRIAHGEQVQIENTAINRECSPAVDNITPVIIYDRQRIERLEDGIQRLRDDMDELRQEHEQRLQSNSLLPFILNDKEREQVTQALQQCMDTNQVGTLAYKIYEEEILSREVLRSTSFYRAIIPLLRFKTTENAVKLAIQRHVP